MTKTIDTLVEDIYNVIEQGVEEFEDIGFARQSGDVLERGLQPRDGQRAARVWFSNAGHPCTRKLWYKLHNPDKAEPLRPHTRIKFLYGDLLEGLLLDLAERAGHTVEYKQERVELSGITGRIDAVIDGVLVDVKSASSYAFKKFERGLTDGEDGFGYLGQLAGYLCAFTEDQLNTDPEERIERFHPNKAAFLAINKETGKLCLDVHEFSDDDLNERSGTLLGRKRIAEEEGETPPRAFDAIPEGKSGNLKLGFNCSYCEFKHHCHPGLRTFLYKGNNGVKPVYLTHVEREPNVPELTEGETLD